MNSFKNIIKFVIWNKQIFDTHDEPQFYCSGIMDLPIDLVISERMDLRILFTHYGYHFLEESGVPSTFKSSLEQPCELIYNPNLQPRWTQLEYLIDIVKKGDLTIEQQSLTQINRSENMFNLIDLRI